MSNSKDSVYVLGMCSGTTKHPSMLWVFKKKDPTHLSFVQIQTDFELPEIENSNIAFQNYFPDMSLFKGCPFCESPLYFFCKKCSVLSCFSWEQIDSKHQWDCPSCSFRYKMKPKTTPFQIKAQTENLESKSTQRNTIDSTLNWFPGKK